MMYKEAVRNIMVFLLPAIVLVGAIYTFDKRTENNVQRMAEACEKAGLGLEIKSISWGGSVEGQCVRYLHAEGEKGQEIDQ
ncbi:MAG: hypothetical protein WD397_07825 [Wenzhouxiangellaceae bacterium]